MLLRLPSSICFLDSCFSVSVCRRHRLSPSIVAFHQIASSPSCFTLIHIVLLRLSSASFFSVLLLPSYLKAAP
ncbi:uncharacterized protein G2W53_032735 [Senna tora]|uniref:Uncharacterized protein n=1 Tax=Senna tora TaxID=362788 RepID=A0A834WC48_9FABA|nr:uncharacterized protein G2W53_032735 [Senna tora]